MKQHFTYAILGPAFVLTVALIQTVESRTLPLIRSVPQTAFLKTFLAIAEKNRTNAAISRYLDEIHFTGGSHHPADAHHECSMLSPDLTQCIIYDKSTSDAKMIGTEDIVSENIFREFSEEEKKLWHHHRAYETLESDLAREGWEKMRNTYGKIWYAWTEESSDMAVEAVPSFSMDRTRMNEEKKTGINPPWQTFIRPMI